MGTNNTDYNFATHLLKFLMIEQRDWKPHLNYLYEDNGPLNTCLQEKIKHTMYINSFHVKYRSWFEDKEPTFDNFRRLADLVTSDYIQRRYDDEEFLNFSVEIGTHGISGYLSDIKNAPDYAVGCIIYALKYFRAEGQFRNHLNFFRWVHGDMRNIEKHSCYFLRRCSRVNRAADSPQSDSSPEPMSSGIESDCPNDLEKLQIDSDAFQSENQNKLDCVDETGQNNRSLSTVVLQSQLRDQRKIGECSSQISQNKENLDYDHFSFHPIPPKRLACKVDSGITEMDFELNEPLPDVVYLYEKKFDGFAFEHVNVSSNLLKPSTSGEYQKVSRPVRRLKSNPTNLKNANFKKDSNPERYKCSRSKSVSECSVQIENQSKDLVETPNEITSLGSCRTNLPSDSSATSVEATIVSSKPKKHKTKIRSSSKKAKLGEFSSPEKLNFSPKSKSLKRLKSYDETQSLQFQRHTVIKRTVSAQNPCCSSWESQQDTTLVKKP